MGDKIKYIHSIKRDGITYEIEPKGMNNIKKDINKQMKQLKIARCLSYVALALSTISVIINIIT